MALVDPKMGLTIWNRPLDPYDFLQLANDWNILAFHDHTPGRGVPIPAGGLATNAVATANIQNSAITNPKLAPSTRRLATVIPGGPYTAQAGDWVVAAGGITVTLPAASGNTDVQIGIVATSTATGSNQVTVQSTSLLKGIGFLANNFVLGTPFSFAILQSDGTQWRIIAGGQDTGWLTLTLNGAVTGSSGVLGWTPAVRVTGNTAMLRGSLTATSNPSFWTSPLPTVAQPTNIITFLGATVQHGAIDGFDPYPANIGATSQIAIGSLSTGAPSSVTEANIFLDGVTYSLANT